MATVYAEPPAALRERQLAVVDIEGNGHHPAEIIEIAIIPVAGQVIEPEAIRSWLIRPQHAIVPFVTRQVHGISNKDVADSPEWETVAPAVEQNLIGRTLVAHNANVERKVLARHLPQWQPPMVLDTLKLAKAVWPGLPSYTLERLIQHAALDTAMLTQQRLHRAGYDAWAAWMLLCRLIRDSGLDWDGLVRAASVPGTACS